MKVVENIYSKMFKIDIVMQQITFIIIIVIIIIIIVICLYYIINNFIVVFWGKEKKSLFSSNALVEKKQLSISLVKSNKCFLIKIEHPVTYLRSSKFLLGCTCALLWDSFKH